MNVDNIGVEKYSVSQLFNQDESFVYEVPKYQREYKWRVREWEALYDDLTENGAGYFLGLRNTTLGLSLLLRTTMDRWKL